MQVSTLDTLVCGRTAEVLAICDGASGDARHLRRMGLREGVRVEVLSGASPVMLRVEGCNLAVCRSMLRCVTIGCCADAASAQPAGSRDACPAHCGADHPRRER